MRRFLFVGVFALIAVLGGAWWHFAGREYVVRLSQDDIRQQLERKLPIKRSFLLVFEVELAHPRAQLRDGSDRVTIGLDVTLNVHIGNQTKPLGGSVDAETGIRYDSGDHGFHLTDPVVTHLDLQGVPDEYRARAAKAVNAALADFLGRYPIYTLQPTDVKHSAARLLLKSVVVANNALVITLGL